MMKNKKQVALIIRWTARIWGSLSLAFMLLFVGAHIIGNITEEGEIVGKFNSLSELVSFAFFPVSIIIGLGIALKREGLGGFVTLGGIVGFYIIRPDLIFNLTIVGLAMPGLFYILYWLLSKSIMNGKNSA